MRRPDACEPAGRPHPMPRPPGPGLGLTASRTGTNQWDRRGRVYRSTPKFFLLYVHGELFTFSLRRWFSRRVVHVSRWEEAREAPRWARTPRCCSALSPRAAALSGDPDRPLVSQEVFRDQLEPSGRVVGTWGEALSCFPSHFSYCELFSVGRDRDPSTECRRGL